MCRSLQFRPLAADDLESVAVLARLVWQATYTGIIAQAQIDLMLAARYSRAALREYFGAEQRWFDLAVLDGEIVAYCACEVYKGEYKLDKIYIHPKQQRLGIGGALIDRAGERGRRLGWPTLSLAVNKRNTQAISAYRKYGFSVREAVCVDIGNGYVMDDFIMQKML